RRPSDTPGSVSSPGPFEPPAATAISPLEPSGGAVFPGGLPVVQCMVNFPIPQAAGSATGRRRRMSRSIRHPGPAFAGLLALALAHPLAANAADPVRGKQLYEVTNGAPLACANSGCHGTNVAQDKNNILKGANNGSLIMSAISK